MADACADDKAGAVSCTPSRPAVRWLTTSRKLGARLNVVGLVDPDVKRAAARLAEKVAAGVHGYQDTVVFPSIAAAGQGIKGIPQCVKRIPYQLLADQR